MFDFLERENTTQTRKGQDKTREKLITFRTTTTGNSVQIRTKKKKQKRPNIKTRKTQQSTPPTSLENMAEPSNCKKNFESNTGRLLSL